MEGKYEGKQADIDNGGPYTSLGYKCVDDFLCVMRILKEIGKPSVEPLAPLLQHENQKLRRVALATLCLIADDIEEPDDVYPHIISALDSQDATLRGYAASALKSQTGEDFGEDSSKWRQWLQRRRGEASAELSTPVRIGTGRLAPSSAGLTEPVSRTMFTPPTVVRIDEMEERIYAEFQEACRGAGQGTAFLLDPDTNEPLPMYIAGPEPPPKKSRKHRASTMIVLGMTRAQVKRVVGYPDDYFLRVSPGSDPPHPKTNNVEEAWEYGNEVLWFDKKKDRLERIERR